MLRHCANSSAMLIAWMCQGVFSAVMKDCSLVVAKVPDLVLTSSGFQEEMAFTLPGFEKHEVAESGSRQGSCGLECRMSGVRLGVGLERVHGPSGDFFSIFIPSQSLGRYPSEKFPEVLVVNMGTRSKDPTSWFRGNIRDSGNHVLQHPSPYVALWAPSLRGPPWTQTVGNQGLLCLCAVLDPGQG